MQYMPRKTSVMRQVDNASIQVGTQIEAVYLIQAGDLAQVFYCKPEAGLHQKFYAYGI
jgi:hypothetical protein